MWGLLAASFAGFLDAAYLAAKHYIGTPVSCSLVEGCETVLGSQYATIGNIPVALAGTVYYLAVFLLVMAYVDTKKQSILLGAAYAAVIGFSASLWFLYLQLFLLKAICIYCIFSAISSSVLFVLGICVIVENHKFYQRTEKLKVNNI